MMLRQLIVATFGMLAIGAAQAAATCEKQADDKKLAGAARTSFVTKCTKDAGAPAAGSTAQATCDRQADDKKLAGAARTSFTTKCVKDATAPAK